MLDAAPPGTVAMSYIYLQQKGVKNAPTRKIRFPKTYEGLWRTVERLYGNVMTVRSLITDEGVVVQDITDVVPGATILVSHLEPGTNKIPLPPASPVVHDRKIMSKQSFAFLFGNGEPKASMQDFDPQGTSQTGMGSPRQGSGRRNEFGGDKDQHAHEPAYNKGAFDEDDDPANLRQGGSGSHTSRSQKGQTDASETSNASKQTRPRKGVKSSVSYLVSSPNKSLLDMDEDELNTSNVRGAVSMTRVPRISGRTGRRNEATDGRQQGRRRSVAGENPDEDDQSQTKSRKSDNFGSEDDNQFDLDDEESRQSQSSARRSRHGGAKRRGRKTGEADDNEGDTTKGSPRRQNARGRIKPSVSYLPTSPNKGMFDGDGQIRTAMSMSGLPGRAHPLEDETENPSETGESVKSSRSQTRRRKRVKKVKKGAKAQQEQEQNEAEKEPETMENLDESSDFEALEKSAALIDAFTQLLGKTSIERKVPKATDALPEFAESLNLLPTMEEQQMTIWQQRLLQIAEMQGLGPLGDDLFGVDDMIGSARSLLVDHRFTHGYGFNHRHNIGIIGPRGSGKSTFLRIVAEEAILDLAATGEWKKTFVFILDWAKICSHVENLIEFYQAMVAVTLQQLQWQRPHFSKYLKMIQKHFESVTSLKRPPVLPKTFSYNSETKELALGLQKLTARLSASWNDPAGLTNWVNNIVTFPDQIAKAFGFKTSLLIFDHVDMMDITLSGIESPFQESEEFVYVIDVVKFAARNANFIMACQDQEKFYTILPSMTDDPRSNINDYIRLVSMIGLVPDPHEDKQFYVDIKGFNVPLVITTHHCGGIPAYLHIWDGLNELYERTQAEDGDEDPDELKLLMNVHMEQAIQVLFKWTVNIEEDEFQVTEVRRKAKKSQEKSRV